MQRKTLIGGLVALVALAVTMGIVALAKDDADKNGRETLSGTWRLDPSRSDKPSFRGGMRGPQGGVERDTRAGDMGHAEGAHPGPGEWSGHAPDGSSAGEARRRGMRGGRLPATITITQTASLVSIADSTGTALLQIATSGSPDTTSETPQIAGRWDDGHLEVERGSWRGVHATQTFTLENHGKTLVIRTQRPARDEMPARDRRRVYQRVGA